MGKAQGLEGGMGWPPVNGAAFFAQAGVGATFAAGAYAGGSGGSVGASFDVAVSDEYQAAIMDADTDGDGTLSAAELAADPQAAAMVEAIQQSICDQLPSCSGSNADNQHHVIIEMKIQSRRRHMLIFLPKFRPNRPLATCPSPAERAA